MNRLKFLGAALALALSTQACAAGGLADLGVYDRHQGRQLTVHRQAFPGFVPDPPGVTLLRHGGHG